jgi:hypothetical protein
MPMARFFVHIDDTDGRVIDEEGYEAADLSTLQCLLRETAAEIIHHEIVAGRPSIDLTFHVEDELRLEVLVLPIHASVPH